MGFALNRSVHPEMMTPTLSAERQEQTTAARNSWSGADKVGVFC